MNYENPHTKVKSPLISPELYDFALTFKDRIEAEIAYSRDFEFDYFGYKTLERSYLL